MSNIKVFYNDKQVHDAASFSKSPLKPGPLSRRIALDPKFSILQDFPPATPDHLKLVHDADYVDDVLMGVRANGFGNRSIKDAAAICYTVGNLLTAMDYAYDHKTVAWSLTSGFHHAGHDFSGGFCTFDGLTLAAEQLHRDVGAKTLIIDEDAHYGNGCTDIIERLGMDRYCRYMQSEYTHSTNDLIGYARQLRSEIERFEPDMILYQAGADNWVCDPLGGTLTMQEMYERDYVTFKIVQEFNIPIAVTLAGGYAENYDDTLRIHLNTGEAMKAAYLGATPKPMYPVHAMELEHA
jgi:acetoin utilization deacetylase AcuC-like enzyme